MLIKYLPSDRAQKPAYRPKLLIIDDEGIYLDVIKQAFAELLPECKVATANDGLQALTTIGSFLPDIIIMDICMPGLDGIKILRFLKVDKQYPNMKIIIITGLTRKDDRLIKVLELGVDGLFFKPFKINELIDLIRSFSDNQSESPEMALIKPR
jgi:CheY-like chemotaxis protein